MTPDLCPACEHDRTARRTLGLMNWVRVRLGMLPRPAQCAAVIGSAESDTGYAEPCVCTAPAHGS